MKINTPRSSQHDIEAALQALEAFLQQPGPRDAPPCPGCHDHQPDSCSATCPDAPAALSIDPVKYPIEDKVIPLVYELFSLRLMQPCWSCEGHTQNTAEGEPVLWKVPQVCFYSTSPVYPQLLLRCLNNLRFTKKIHYPWHVVLSDFSQTWDVTYSIQPNLSQVERADLDKIQQDLLVIGNSLYFNMRAEAAKMQAELKALKPGQ